MLKLMSILLPPLLIGSFELIRHKWLLSLLSMEVGNYYITLLTLLLSYLFTTWMFNRIHRINHKLGQEQAVRAVYEDRDRLAQELHDDLAQSLFYLNVKLKQGHLEDARSAVSEIDHSLRQAIYNLRTPPEQSVSLTSRLRKWLQEWQIMTGIHVRIELQLQGASFSEGEEIQLFSVVQEAFTNIRKHSEATEATLQFGSNTRGWSLHVSDNGRGIQHSEDGRKRYGIVLMQKRAAELGANWELQSSPGKGTELRLYTTTLQTAPLRSLLE